jgi:hypothetical protein
VTAKLEQASLEYSKKAGWSGSDNKDISCDHGVRRLEIEGQK